MAAAKEFKMFDFFSPARTYSRLPSFNPEPLFTTKTEYYRHREDNDYTADDVFKIMKMSSQGLSTEDISAILSTKEFRIDEETVTEVLEKVQDAGFNKS